MKYKFILEYFSADLNAASDVWIVKLYFYSVLRCIQIFRLPIWVFAIMDFINIYTQYTQKSFSPWKTTKKYFFNLSTRHWQASAEWIWTHYTSWLYFCSFLLYLCFTIQSVHTTTIGSSFCIVLDEEDRSDRRFSFCSDAITRNRADLSYRKYWNDTQRQITIACLKR